MDAAKIPLGTKFDLELINSLGERIGKVYVSQLLDITDSQNIIISCPIHESRLTFIANGTKIRVIFLSDKLGLLCFTGIITGKEKTENIIALNVRIESEIDKIQRRNHYRLDCFLEGKYSEHIDPAQKSSNAGNQIKPQKILVKNISGSGACIVSENQIPGGSYIDLAFSLSADVSIKAVCKVIRSSLMENSRDRRYETGLYFKEISQKDQDQLIKYIFKQQSLNLKNNVNAR